MISSTHAPPTLFRFLLVFAIGGVIAIWFLKYSGPPAAEVGSSDPTYDEAPTVEPEAW